MPTKHLIGITSHSGVQYVGIDMDTGIRWFRRSLFTATDKVFVAALSARGIYLVGKEGIDAFKAKLDRLIDFPDGTVAETPGWNMGDVYVLDEGSIFATDMTIPIPVALQTPIGKGSQAGTLEGWQQTVAKPIAKQPLAAFLVMAAFMPVVLRFMPHVPNAVFEVVGRGGIGKTTLLRHAASVYGGTGSGRGNGFWHSFGLGASALPHLVDAHRDQPLILDEVNALLASSDKKAVANAYLQLGHGLGRAASSQHASGGPYRGLVIMAGNDSLRVLAGKPPIEGDQIITLTVPPWPHGVFPTLPAHYPNGADYAEALATAASLAHGTAIRAFLPALLADMTDLPRLQRRLDRWQDRFLTAAGVDRNNGQALRTARVFAAIYAAGMLAKRCKVLPGAFVCLAAALTCYRLHLDATQPPVPLRERLEELIASGRIVTVTKGAEPDVKERVRTSLGTLTFKRKYREVRVPPERIYDVFPDWDQRRQEALSCGLLHGEGGGSAQDKAKAKLAPWLEKDRLYCFRLPLPEPSMFAVPAQAKGEGAVEPDNDDEWDSVAAE